MKDIFLRNKCQLRANPNCIYIFNKILYLSDNRFKKIKLEQRKYGKLF